MEVWSGREICRGAAWVAGTRLAMTGYRYSTRDQQPTPLRAQLSSAPSLNLTEPKAACSGQRACRKHSTRRFSAGLNFLLEMPERLLFRHQGRMVAGEERIDRRGDEQREQGADRHAEEDGDADVEARDGAGAG